MFNNSMARTDMSDSFASDTMLEERETMHGSTMTAEQVQNHPAKMEADFYKHKPGIISERRLLFSGKQRRTCKIDTKGWFSYYDPSNKKLKGFFLLGPETAVRIDANSPHKWYLTSRTDYSASGD